MTVATDRQVPADTLRARLLLLRDEKGWSQREAAEACGLTYGEWQSMEAGHEARGLPKKLKKIASASGYDLDWLLWGGPLGSDTPPPRGRLVKGTETACVRSRSRSTQAKKLRFSTQAAA